MSTPRILFICENNGSRSQMAEAFMRRYGQDHFKVMSAGLEPTGVPPLTREAMDEVGMDLSSCRSSSVFALGDLEFEYVITLCNPETTRRCPDFNGSPKRMHWAFPDPARATGTHAEKLAAVRTVRDDIKAKIIRFINEIS